MLEMNIHYFCLLVIFYCIISGIAGYFLGYKYAKGRKVYDQRSNGKVYKEQSSS